MKLSNCVRVSRRLKAMRCFAFFTVSPLHGQRRPNGNSTQPSSLWQANHSQWANSLHLYFCRAENAALAMLWDVDQFCVDCSVLSLFKQRRVFVLRPNLLTTPWQTIIMMIAMNEWFASNVPSDEWEALFELPPLCSRPVNRWNLPGWPYNDMFSKTAGIPLTSFKHSPRHTPLFRYTSQTDKQWQMLKHHESSLCLWFIINITCSFVSERAH